MATPKKRSSPPPTPQPSTRRSNAGVIMITAVVAAVVVIGLVVALVVGGDDDDDSGGDGGVASTLALTPNGVAICNADERTDDTAPVDTASAEGDDLAPFPDDEIFKPVVVVGDPLPEFSEEIQQGSPDTALCTPAPVVSGYDYTGNEITIDPATQGPTMVVLLAHWCPHCNREIPVLNDWRDSGDVPDELNVVGVSTGIRPDAANYPPDEWLATMDWTWPVLADADISTDDPADGADSAFRAYGGTTFPTMILVGSDGDVLARFSGEYPVDVIQGVVDDALEQDAAS